MTSPNWTAVKKRLKAAAAGYGFEKLGVTDIDLAAPSAAMQQWLNKNFHGDMSYMERNLAKRADPAQLEPFTLRVISARMNYLTTDAQPLEVLKNPRQAYVARYALGRDYHKVVRRRLAKLAAEMQGWAGELTPPVQGEYRAFCDSAPVLEKPLGAKAGLGWVGKHTLLLDPDVGSWFFLGEIFTNLPLPVDEQPVANQCGNCSACMTVCPTDAIVAPGQLDARRCIAYLTIEHKGSIPEPLREPMGNRVFGCDDCQLYCPWNRDAPASTEPDFTPRHNLSNPDLLTLFGWSEAEFLQHTEGSAIRRVSYEQWQRNLAVALGNGPAEPGVLAALTAARPTSTPLVVEHIDWALKRLQNPESNRTDA